MLNKPKVRVINLFNVVANRQFAGERRVDDNKGLKSVIKLIKNGKLDFDVSVLDNGKLDMDLLRELMGLTHLAFIQFISAQVEDAEQAEKLGLLYGMPGQSTKWTRERQELYFNFENWVDLLPDSRLALDFLMHPALNVHQFNMTPDGKIHNAHLRNTKHEAEAEVRDMVVAVASDLDDVKLKSLLKIAELVEGKQVEGLDKYYATVDFDKLMVALLTK